MSKDSGKGNLTICVSIEGIDSIKTLLNDISSALERYQCRENNKIGISIDGKQLFDDVKAVTDDTPGLKK